MNTNFATVGRPFDDPCCSAVGAFVFTLLIVRATEHFDSRYLTGTVLSGAFLIPVLFWTRRAGRRLAAGKTARKHATQFLWSCIFFIMLSLSFGIAVTRVV